MQQLTSLGHHLVCQWEFQDPYVGYRWSYMGGTSNKSVPGMAIDYGTPWEIDAGRRTEDFF